MDDLEINTPALKVDSAVIGEYLGFSGEHIEDDSKKILSIFNDAIKISHYGKRATLDKHVSKEYRLLEADTYQQVFNLSNQQAAQMRNILRTIHMNVLICDDAQGSIVLYFLGSETWSCIDNWQLLCTAFNATGPVYNEIPGLVMLFKHILTETALELDLVCGHSLGAGVAQCFAMAVDCKRLIMLDPQLLTESQQKLAMSISNKVELHTPHGIAIVVDSPIKPSGGLTTRMKKHGFNHPGILLLKLSLLPSDGNGFVTEKDGSVRQVTEDPRVGKFGYHGSKPDMVLFTNAIERLIYA
ncbi:hypothetical protein BGZ83_001332 [Gryganskiella cystojenkinii]|nr:hypothetical protein BGZ83_001332 [Gryganskiella cystojenkinii]